jgi:hypothetical protein
VDKSNTVLDDICVDIGFTATNSLANWFGGEYLQVPVEISEMHPIAKAIGARAAVRLAATWGGRRVWIPLAYWHGVDRRDRFIGEALVKGTSCDEISSQVGLSVRRVQQIKVKLERVGLLKMLAEIAQEKTGAENAQGKIGGENSQEKTG